jgi:hypothetical protein
MNFFGYSAGNYLPPDTQGAVGPDHLITVCNEYVVIHNKATGAPITTFTASSFWAQWVDIPVPEIFDARVLYDPFDNHWIMSAAMGRNPGSHNSILLGVSVNSNPTQPWHAWRIEVDPNLVNFADFPRLGFNHKWIVVVGDIGPFQGGSLTPKVYIFNKSDKYAGGSSPPTIRTVDTSGYVPAVTLDNSVDTLYLLYSPDGNPTSQLRIATITGSIGNESFNPSTFFAAGYSWGTYMASGLPEKGTSTFLPASTQRAGNCVYRNGSIWFTHGICLPASIPTHAAVQWWQLSPLGTVQQHGVMEDTSGVLHFSYPSLAVNQFNDVLLGYSSFSVNQYPSADYCFRYGVDAANYLRRDALFHAGKGAYTQNRWGDYSAAAVDPVNDSSLWATQEYSETDSQTWGLWWAKIVPENSGDFDGDGRTDIVFEDTSTLTKVWTMSGATRQSETFLIPSSLGGTWRVAGTSDINQDGRVDLFLQDASYNLGYWMMNGTSQASSGPLNPSSVAGTTWQIVATGDFNRDALADLLWEDASGSLALWHMNGTSLNSATLLNPSSPGGDPKWRIVGTGDFDRDGNVDILWQYSNPGGSGDSMLGVWYMNDANLRNSVLLNPAYPSDPRWRVVAIGDYNGDGWPDILFQLKTAAHGGSLGVWFMNGINLTTSALINPSDPGTNFDGVGPK